MGAGVNGFAEALVHESPDGMIALSPDGTILFWNLGAQAIFGYSAQEAVGQSVEALVIPEDRQDEARLAMVEVLDRGVALFETERRRKDGTRVAVDVTLRLIRGATGDVTFVAANHKDITQLRKLRDECATEAKFRGLLEAAPDAIVIVGGDGRIAFVNSETEAVFGYRRDELLGQSIERLVPEHFRRTHPGRRTAQGARGVRPLNAEIDLFGRRKDGSEFPCEITLAPMETEGGRLITAAIRDITARKKEAAKFRSLLEGAPDAMVIVNQAGNVVLVNSQAETLFGHERQAMIGKGIEMLLPETERGGDQERRARFFADPKVHVMGGGLESVARRKDGGEFPVEISVSPLETEDGTLILSAIRDITERKKAEDKFRALMEAAPDAMVITDQEGRILLVNAQTEALFGHQREELIGQRAEQLVPARFRSHAHAQGAGFFIDAEVRSTGSGSELCGLRKDDTEFPIEISSSPIHTEEGTLISSAIRDITERKVMEERMQQANRMKSEFLANMSHELRTPLNAIIGFTELMHYGDVEPGSSEQKEFLVHILTSGRHLLQLVNDILDLSKIEAGKMEFRPEPINLRNEINEVVAMLSPLAARKRIEVSIKVSDLSDIVLDPARLKQVLYNYLSNALKFTPEGGAVVVRVLPEIGQRFRLEVEDTGVGIRPSDLSALFVEFQQLDSAATKRHGGTGLGLALTKRIVEAQNGSVGVRSVLGEGSVFYATLPRRSRLTVHVQQPASVKAVPGNGPAILVIDDDDADRDLLVRTLGGAGYAIETASNAHDGLAALRARTFDAVTIHLAPHFSPGLDPHVARPDVSGLRVLQEMRRNARTAAIPVVVVTMVNETGAISSFLVEDVLAKPPAPDALARALTRAGIERDQRGTILVVDEDADTLALMKNTLTELGFHAVCQSDARGALHTAAATVLQAVIIDLGMHRTDGFALVEGVRSTAENREVPVVLWTSDDLSMPSLPGRNGPASLGPKTPVASSRARGSMVELLQEMKRVLPRRAFAEKETVNHVRRAHLDR